MRGAGGVDAGIARFLVQKKRDENGFEPTGGKNSFHRLRELLPPPVGGPPPSKREVLGGRGNGRDGGLFIGWGMAQNAGEKR